MGCKIFMKILVAEDDFRSADVFEKLLDMKGYQVEVTHDGFECLERYNKEFKNTSSWKSKSDPYDVLLLDFSMPKLDGVRLAQAIKKLRPSQRIIIVTAYSKDLLREFPKDCGDLQLIEKPISLSKLIIALEGNHSETISQKLKKSGLTEWDTLGELDTPPVGQKQASSFQNS